MSPEHDAEYKTMLDTLTRMREHSAPLVERMELHFALADRCEEIGCQNFGSHRLIARILKRQLVRS